MGPHKRLGTIAISSVLAISAIWLACLMVLVLLQPGASRANKAYHLGSFSAHTNNLAASLQQELFLIAMSGDRAQGADSSLLANAATRTDFDRHDVAKNWGRFDSAPYSPMLGRLVENALQSLEPARGSQSSSGIADAALFFAPPTNDLLGIGKEFDLLRLENDELGRLRAQLSRVLQHARLLNDELVAGVRLLSGPRLDDRSAKSLAEAISKRREFPGINTAQPSAGAVQKAASLGETLHILASSRSQGAFPPISGWVKDYAKAIETLVHTSNHFQSELTALAKSSARRADTLFILAVIAAATLTALLLARRGHLDRSALLVLVFAAVNIPLITWRLASGSEFLADESGVMENAQVIVLALAFVFFSLDALRTHPALRAAAVVMACLCLFMFFREMDFRTLGASEWVISLSSGPGRRKLFYAGLAILLAYAVMKRRQLLAVFPAALSLRAWPLYLWPVLLLAGEAVELQTHATRKDDLPGFWSTGQFWEELLELDAYIVLVFAALSFSAIMLNKTGKKANRPSRAGTAPAAQGLPEQPVE